MGERLGPLEVVAIGPGTATLKSEVKDFSKPDETRSFNHGKAEIVTSAGGALGRLTLEPGWKWSNDVKPIAETDFCEEEHHGYCVSGSIASCISARDARRSRHV